MAPSETPPAAPAAAIPAPPVAPSRARTLTHHGHSRTDPWYGLRDADDPEVIAHLEAENAYTEAVLAPTEPLRRRIFGEIRGRVQETDESAPVRRGPWEYVTLTTEGLQYPRHVRRPARGAPTAGGGPGESTGAPAGEQLLVDENALADGSDYFALGALAVSPSQDLVAYSTDHTGAERYTLRFRRPRDVTASGDGCGPDGPGDPAGDPPDEITEVSAGAVWGDDHTLFYLRPDATERPYQVWRHTLGTDPSRDKLVFEEPDERFFVGVGRTRSGDVVLIATESKTTSEVRWIPTGAPGSEPRCVRPRTEGVEYSVEHHRKAPGDPGSFVVVTNDGGARDFRIVTAPVPPGGSGTPVGGWREVVAHRPGVRVEDVDAFAGHLVVSERADALTRLRVLPASVLDGPPDGRDPDAAPGPAPDPGGRIVEMPDPVYTAWVGHTPEYDGGVVRLGYSSLSVPTSALDHDLADGTTVLVKRQPVLGGYDPEAYVVARLDATAPDGEAVPVSLVHRRDLALDGSAPCLLYGYGAYEHSIDPVFSSVRVSLLDRGFVFAIAHVRGGGEKGRRWYEEGRLEAKENTFTDFVACAEALVAAGCTSPGRLAARGGSAGGMLMGAVANLRPDLFRVIVAEVPFVDCLTTMLDPSLPLTVTEWEEWGDPLHDPDAYHRMLGYAPYDNVGAHPYPAMLVTAGINDPRVGFWEPAKWVARIRATATTDPLVLLDTKLGAGHGGLSGRYDAWLDEARVLAFLVDGLGAPEEPLPRPTGS